MRQKHPAGPPMTIRLCEMDRQAVDMMVDHGFGTNRNDYIRRAIHYQLVRDGYQADD